jgi:uncharacterized protein (TIGR03067 family)
MRVLQLTLVLAAVVLLAADEKDKAAKKDADPLQGTWKLTGGKVRGDPLPEGEDGGKWVLKDGKYTFTSPEMVEEGTYKIDTSKKPAQLDLDITAGNDKGKKQVGIYKVEGETLTVCLAFPGGKERPSEFDTKEGSDRLLFIFKREKP